MTDFQNQREWESGELKLVGTFEPNHYGLKKKVSCWYEGDPAISTERIVEPDVCIDDKKNPFFGHDYRFKDKRYAMYVRQVREHEIEQDIERIRFIFSEGEKVAYLFTMLPIDFETKKTTITNLFLDMNAGWSKPLITVLESLVKCGYRAAHVTLYEKTRRLKDVKEVGFPKLIKELLDSEIIKEVGKRGKRVYQFTENGRMWYEDYKKGLAEFKGK